MHPLLKILLNNETPSQELVDYKIDKEVEKIIESYASTDRILSEIDVSLLHLDLPQPLRRHNVDAQLSLHTTAQHVDLLGQRIKQSLARHYPYIHGECSLHPRPQVVNGVEYRLYDIVLMLNLTKEVKQNLWLQAQLEQPEAKRENRKKL